MYEKYYVGLSNVVFDLKNFSASGELVSAQDARCQIMTENGRGHMRATVDVYSFHN